MRLKRALVTFISLIVVAVGFFSVPVNGDSPQPDVLLVKDAHRDPEGLGRDMNKLLAPYYINAIKSVNPPGPQTSLDYDNCTISDTQGEGPDWDSSGGCDERIGGLKNYDIVIWFTGNDGTACEIPTLQPQDPGSSDKCPDVGVYGDDRLQLKKFLENGGTLFVSGENIGHDREYYWDVYNNFDFYQDYLKADPDIIDSDNQGWRKDIEAGANNDPIGDGMAYPEDIYLTGSGGAGNWEHPDYIWEVDYPVLAYAQIYGYWIRSAVRGNTGGPDGFKSVFFSFSFASINSSMKREKLMRRIHYYLSAPSTLNGNLWMDKIEGSGWTGWNITCDRWNDGFCLRNSNPPKVNATCVNKQLFTDVQDSQWRVEGTGYSDNLGAANGTYYEDDVIFVNGTIDISGLEAPGQVGSYTLKVRCQDESDFWGQNDTYHFGVDRYYPRFVDEEVNISEGRDYTDKVKPNIMVELYDAAWDEFNVEPENYNYFRFSCNKTDWTEWKSYQKPYSDFNITDPDYGCDTGNGNRTVYVQLRDKAGNFKSSVIGKDWIVLDRKAPQITSITPQNDSYIRPEDNITVTFRDSAPQDGKRSGVSQSLFDNETYNISFNNNTEFNHGWSSAGVINADIFLKDGVGNLNVTSYRFRVDDMPPSTYDNATGLFSNNSNYFNNWHWYGSNQTVSLICDDPDISSGVSGSGCNVTLYCLNDTESGSCSPHIHGKSKEVGCSEGEVCVQWMVYRSNDTLNNTETPKISANISIDKKAPNVSIDEPSGWVRGWIDLNATVLDQTPGSGVDTALYNLSNSTWSDSGELTQGAGGFYTKDLDTTQLAGGPYNVTFLANDSVGNKNYTQRINITVDNTPPDVTLEEPIDAWIANQTPLFNFTPSDGLAPELNCTLVVNGLRNASIIVQNGSTDGTRPTGPIPEGKGHEWNVNCTDKAGNSEKPQYPKKFDIDVTKPGITLNLPENETWIATKEPTFNFTPSDNLASELECIAYANQSVQKGGANFTLDGPKLIYSDPIQEGSQPWWINCTDKAGNRRKSLERTINIDVSGPNTTDNSTGIWSPENKTILLSCEDLPSQNPVGCNETYYCVGSSCEDFESVPTNETPKGRAEVNYTLELGCVEGEIFEEKISYRSNDSLANLEGVKTSSYPVRIDKQDPSTWDNVSSIWRNSNETVKLSCTDSGSGCNFTSYCINSSELSCQYSSEPANFSLEVGCPQGEVCRKQVVYYSNDSVNNTEDANLSSPIRIDKRAPHMKAIKLNISVDQTFNQSRVYPGDGVKFFLNASDVVNISKILVTLNTPTQPPANKTLSLGPGNLSRGRWSFVYTPQNLGLYNFTQLYANDSLGNMNASLSANKQFRVVNATLEVKLDSGSAVNAGFNSSFNASLKLNKTFEAPFARLFVPPNTYANTSQEPWFTNLSTYQCSFNKSGGGCQIAAGNDSQPAPTYLNLSGTGNGTNFSLENPTIEVETPLQDVNATWLARFHRFTYHNKTKIKTPLLNISQILCDGSSPCIVDQLAGFNLTVVVENVQEPAHTGLAKGVNVKFETDAPANLTRNTSSLGDVGSGEQNSTQWGINISEAGKYTLTLRSWDTTGSYNTSRKKTIEVKDILEPEIINLSWKDNNLFNVNETVNYTVEAKDNTGVDEVWLSTNKSNFLKNHTLSRYKGSPTYGSWRLSYNNTTSPGTYGIVEIYANDSNSNIENVTPTGDLSKFKVRNILLNASLSHEKMEINTSQTFYLNVTGNASQISKVKATVQKPHDVNESVELSLEEGLNTSPYETYKFVGTYENATFSRNYTANMNVTLSSGVWRATSVDFNVSFGNVSLEPEREVLTLPENATYKLSWYVIPSDGDLTGVNASLNITNKSLVNLSSQVSKTKNLGDIYWEEYGSEGHETKWEINTSSTTGETNLTLRVNSTTPSTPISGQNESGEMKIEVIEEDDTKPTIEEVWLEWSVVNLNHMQKIWVNATDEKTVVKKEALVEISWPSGAKKNLTAEKTKEGLYKLEFSQINETGNYSFRTIVYDVAGNKNASGWKNFSASDEYLVNVVTSLPRRNESISKYNKEENVSIRVDVSTVNELTVNDFNLTLKVYNATGNETLLNHTAKERGYYFIREANKPLQTGSVGDINHPTYYAYAEVSGSGNSGGNKTSFDVYKYLSTDFKNPDKGEYFKAGASINVSISVTNIRGEEVKDAVVTAYCSDCPEKKQIRLEYSPNSSYVTPSSFEAPSEDFSIDATSLDPGKNKDPDGVHPYVPLNSGTPPPGGAPPREGGEGGAAAPLPKIEVLGPPRRLPSTADETWLKVRTDRAGECEYSSKDFSYGNGTDFEESNGTLHKAKVKVSAGQSYYYRIKCKVGERISEDSVAFSVKPKMIKKFKTEYEHTVLVPRGENATVWVDFINIGDKTVTVVPTARSECCDLGFAVREVEIRPGSRRSVKLGVHVPLSIHPGNYTSFLTFKSGKVERERIIQIGVSEHLLTRKLSEINSSVPKLREDLKDLEKVGLDVSSLKEKLEDVQRLVKEGEEAIQSDDLEELRAKVKEAQRKKNQIEGKIGGLKFKQFLLENKWNILAAILTFFFGSYLLTQLLIPWYRLGKTVSSLEEEKEESIQTRKKAEKQYFRREIDEPTFRDIMTEEQDKILHLRGEVEKNKKRLDTLVSRALSPRKILVFPVNSARKLYQKSVELKERKEGFREYLVGGMSTLREDLEEIGGMEIGAGAKVKSWVFRVPEALAEVFQKIKPTKKRGKAVREYGKKKEFKRPEEEKEKEFEEEAEPELEGIEKPEERVSKVTEIRKRIEKEREKDKNE